MIAVHMSSNKQLAREDNWLMCRVMWFLYSWTWTNRYEKCPEMTMECIRKIVLTFVLYCLNSNINYLQKNMRGMMGSKVSLNNWKSLAGHMIESVETWDKKFLVNRPNQDATRRNHVAWYCIFQFKSTRYDFVCITRSMHWHAFVRWYCKKIACCRQFHRPGDNRSTVVKWGVSVLNKSCNQLQL
jgi:hypothetical protein